MTQKFQPYFVLTITADANDSGVVNPFEQELVFQSQKIAVMFAKTVERCAGQYIFNCAKEDQKVLILMLPIYWRICKNNPVVGINQVETLDWRA